MNLRTFRSQAPGGVALIRGGQGSRTGVFVFRRTLNGWVNTQFLPQLTGEAFNDRVVFENQMAVIGGVQNDVPGEAYIYRMSPEKKLRRVGKRARPQFIEQQKRAFVTAHRLQERIAGRRRSRPPVGRASGSVSTTA